MAKDYEYRRRDIEVICSHTGQMRCRQWGTEWQAQFREGGRYYRGSWTCYNCGANSKGK